MGSRVRFRGTLDSQRKLAWALLGEGVEKVSEVSCGLYTISCIHHGEEGRGTGQRMGSLLRRGFGIVSTVFIVLQDPINANWLIELLDLRVLRSTLFDFYKFLSTRSLK
jgi:hypothetical protein